MNPNRNRFLITCLLLLQGVFLSLQAQMPTIKVDGKEAGLVYLQKLNVDVKINGAIATTTWTMTFKNKTGRILEGELNFPLAEGSSVSRYALDINGLLREAVPVEKEKGTRVFENIERRRVDPGLLEKVDGNGFRTRIYPINPNGTRTVLIGYEEQLSWSGSSALLYRLPFAFRQALEEFNVNISVIRSTQQPVFEGNIDNQLHFDGWNDTWTASRSWKNFLADRPVAIRIPKTMGASEIMMQQTGNHYFYVLSTFPTHKRVEKPLPKKITILWDASRSGASRNTEKELQLLDEYFDKLSDVAVTLVTFRNAAQEPQSFGIHDGQWDRLKSVLQNTVYDGATQFGSLDLKKYPGDEFLLFSDGHSTFGSNQWKGGGTPVYAIVTTPKADFPFLRTITQVSGGELINLLTSSATEAREQLLFQSLYFMGVKAAANLEETYPSLPTPVVNSLSIAGISYQPTQRLVLQFGYGGKVTSESVINLDFAKQHTTQLDLSRIWAQKKIAELDGRFDDNKVEIEQLGRRYGIVTRNTSLIVLENVMDYITYEIEPPAELRPEYDRIMKQRGQTDQQLHRATVDNAEAYFNELLHWWTTDYKRPDPVIHKTPAPTPPTPTQPTPQPQPDRPISRQDSAANRSTRNISAGSVTTIRADEISVPPPQMLQGRVAGVDIRSAGSDKALPAATGNTSHLNKVVVVALGVQRKKDARDTEKEGDDPDDAGTDPSGYGNFKSWKADVETEYLARLKAARPADQYTVYLKSRKNYKEAPLFYFNTANFFFAAGKKDVGLRILSNIAELDAESYELYKLLGYKLKEMGEVEAACAVFKKVLDWRPFEPQSYRDYGLALEDAGHYQQALDTLYTALIKNYGADVSAMYPGIEETILPEINNLVARKAAQLDFSRIPRQLLTNMPVDIRVVLNWNMNDTDIDLWVTDPYSEKCYYSHRFTDIGGRISHDFTRGLGPEQFLLKKAVKGKYKVEVNYYGDSQVKIAGPTTLMVEIYLHYGTAAQTRQLITLQMQSTSQGTIYVGEFEF